MLFMGKVTFFRLGHGFNSTLLNHRYFMDFWRDFIGFTLVFFDGISGEFSCDLSGGLSTNNLDLLLTKHLPKIIPWHPHSYPSLFQCLQEHPIGSGFHNTSKFPICEFLSHKKKTGWVTLKSVIIHPRPGMGQNLYGDGSKLGTPIIGWLILNQTNICGPIHGLPFWPTSICSHLWGMGRINQLWQLWQLWQLGTVVPSGPHLHLAVFQDTTQRNLGIGQGHIGTSATLAGLRNLQKFQKKT